MYNVYMYKHKYKRFPMVKAWKTGFCYKELRQNMKPTKIEQETN